jgi:hypothetical protein
MKFLSLLAYAAIILLSALFVTYVLVEYLAGCGETYITSTGAHVPYTCVFEKG